MDEQKTIDTDQIVAATEFYDAGDADRQRIRDVALRLAVSGTEAADDELKRVRAKSIKIMKDRMAEQNAAEMRNAGIPKRIIKRKLVEHDAALRQKAIQIIDQAADKYRAMAASLKGLADEIIDMIKDRLIAEGVDKRFRIDALMSAHSEMILLATARFTDGAFGEDASFEQLADSLAKIIVDHLPAEEAAA